MPKKTAKNAETVSQIIAYPGPRRGLNKAEVEILTKDIKQALEDLITYEEMEDKIQQTVYEHLLSKGLITDA